MYVVVWNNAQLSKEQTWPLSPFKLGTIKGKSVRIDNQSQFAVQLLNSQSQLVDYLLPNQFVLMPLDEQNELSLAIDEATVTTVTQPYQMVGYRLINGLVAYQTGSIWQQNSNTAVAEISSNVNANVINQVLDVLVQNALTISGTVQTAITNASLAVTASTPLPVNVDNSTNVPTVINNTTAIPVDVQNAITAKPVATSLIDASGTVTAANTSQQILANGKVTEFLLIANPSAGNMWVNFGAAATTSSLPIPAGASIRFEKVVPTDSVQLIGDTAAAAFVCKYA